jgi:tetratricopeptide (TPR) repeat protein
MIKRISLILLFSCILFATDKTFVREYTYQASDYDSKVTSRANALEQVKRLLLEEVSMFIKSEINMSTTEVSIGGESELNDFYENKITSITAGITETKILEEKWNGVEYWMKAEITIDPDDVDRKVSDIVNSREKLKELEDVKKRADDALAEIERLKKELARSKSDADQLRLTKAYNKETDVLSATDWFNKGYHAGINEEYDKSISFFLRAIELDPDDAALAYYSLGVVYNDQGNLTKAIESYEKAIKINPDAAGAYNNLGLAYKDQGNLTKAIQYYKKAIELDPDAAKAYNNLGIVYANQGNHTKAIEYYKKTIELDPDDAEAYYNLGLTYYLQGNYTKAIQYYKKAIELDPDDAAKAYINLGLLYVQQGNTTKGIKLLQKAARLGHQGTQDWLKKKGYDW